jgi:hypothetical protein
MTEERAGMTGGKLPINDAQLDIFPSNNHIMGMIYEGIFCNYSALFGDPASVAPYPS